MPRFQLAVILSMLLFLLAPEAEPAFRPEVFEYNKGRISIRGKGLTVVDLLNNISDIANIQIFIFDPVDNRRINVDLGNVSCHSALQSIVKSASFAIVYLGKTGCSINTRTASAVADQSTDESIMSNGSHQRTLIRSVTARPTDVFRASGDNRDIDRNGISPNGTVSIKRDGVFLIAGKIDRTQDYRLYDRTSFVDPSIHGSASGSLSSEDDYSYSENVPGFESQNPFISNGQLTALPLETPLSSEHLSQMIEILQQRIASGVSDREYEKWANIKGAKYITHDRDRLDYYQSKLQEQ